MNERIKTLISQAQKEIWGNNPFNGSPEFDGYELDAEKFAELIVKECCSIIEVDLETNKVKAETDNEGRIWTNAQLTFSQLIKSRFDIKEN